MWKVGGVSGCVNIWHSDTRTTRTQKKKRTTLLEMADLGQQESMRRAISTKNITPAGRLFHVFFVFCGFCEQQLLLLLFLCFPLLFLIWFFVRPYTMLSKLFSTVGVVLMLHAAYSTHHCKDWDCINGITEIPIVNRLSVLLSIYLPLFSDLGILSDLGLTGEVTVPPIDVRLMNIF